MSVRRATESDRERWLELRAALRPAVSLEQHDAAIGRVLGGGGRCTAFVFELGVTPASGFVEAARDNDDGGIARIEAIYVVPDARRKGQARVLLDAVGDWATSAGCRELRCNWPLDDQTAHAGLRALGFAETGREVLFSRTLHPAIALGGAGTDTSRPKRITRRPESSGAERSPGLRRLIHGAIICAGVASLLMTDIFSGDLLRGALLPLFDLLFMLYLLAMIAGRQYRRRTDSSERSIRLFDAAPPSRDRDGVE